MILTEVLDEVDGNDRDAIKCLSVLVFGIKLQGKFPRACLQKIVMRKLLIFNAAAMGNRHLFIADSEDSWDEDYVMDFESFASPSWIEEDGVHLTPDGYIQRTRFILQQLGLK